VGEGNALMLSQHDAPAVVVLQFMDSGCENCRWMAEELDHSNLDEFTTSNFSG
jgi:thiol-disulfide isomerase/thioredoxin